MKIEINNPAPKPRSRFSHFALGWIAGIVMVLINVYVSKGSF